MFDSLLNKLPSSVKNIGNAAGAMKDMYDMQKKMKAIKVIGKTKDELIKVHLNGLQEIEHITITEEGYTKYNKDSLGKAIIEAYNKAKKELEEQMQKDMNPEDLKNMLSSIMK